MVAFCEDDVETLSFFTRLSFLLSHSSILSTLFFISLYVSPIWIQKKRSTYFAGWFVSARYSTLSFNKLWPLPISYMYWNNLFFLTSQQISRNFWICALFFRNRNFLIEFPPECHAVLNLWIHCHFRMAFDSFFNCYKIILIERKMHCQLHPFQKKIVINI